MKHLAALNPIRTGISKKFFPAMVMGGGVVLAALLFSGETRAANILTNGGFETGNFNAWTTFGANNYIQSGSSTAHGGTYYYKVYGQFNGVTNFTGIYQDNLSAPSNTYTADGWAYSLTGDRINGQDAIWLEVSFRDVAYNALALYRSTVVTSNNIAGLGGYSKWFDLQVTNQCSFTNPSAQILIPGAVTNTVTNLVAPAGTVFVRYQTVFRQGSDNANGSMYFDDLTLNQTGGTVPIAPQWNIVWCDEFNGNSNSVNALNWTNDIGNGFYSGEYWIPGWGNNELENYTSRPTNVYVANGWLHLRAQPEAYGGQSYTSARLKSMGLFSKMYGRFEWRAKLPAGTGLWPALWMLPQNSPYGGWPNSGEIDVMENNGANPTQEGATIHYGGAGGYDVYSGQTYTFSGGDSVTNWHTYALIWSVNSMQFLVDGNLFETQNNWWSNIGTSSSTYPFPAPFNNPFYILMNLAVGGNYLGNPDTNSINLSLPAEVLMDYVRVYDLTAPLAFTVGRMTNGTFTLSWPTSIVCHVQAKTNSLAGGTGWVDTPITTSPLVVSPDPGKNCVFYRLQSP